ncbi:cytochrome c [Roseateles sp.]|uniref:c-type cytochrome n=1 Tax=Roseateles sp. TaxID=1971397 RepID=UPI00286A3179|nr:cytochrome c [Roseateles sp.]
MQSSLFFRFAAPSFAAVLGLALGQFAQAEPDAPRQQQLLHMLKQDCGSCHGLRMTGGLGPALTREAMQRLPLASVSAAIYHGRPGTAMPPWKTMLKADEAEWLAAWLQSPQNKLSGSASQ